MVELSEPSAEEFLLSLNGRPTEISGNDWIVKKVRLLGSHTLLTSDYASLSLTVTLTLTLEPDLDLDPDPAHDVPALAACVRMLQSQHRPIFC